ncbi:MAG TPA: endonuclease/exonuclease/phosphatase family protein, partial [Rugosimonospora sp.]|nr:endonuclease/exonuclease/phosphatase family protein [Rugosimonospora sp.]
PSRAAGTFVVLQMNLCDSGWARGCFTSGHSIDEAVTKIHKYAPDVVTVNEVCHDDVWATDGWGKLTQAMADLYGDAHIYADFVPAVDRRTNEALRCVNDQFYGVAVIHHDGGSDVHYGWYHSQDTTPEERTWTCVTAIVGRLTSCTTHLSIHRNVAMAQCHELMSTLASASWVEPDVIVSGDFNMTANPSRPYNVRGCVPKGYHRLSDSALQQVFYTGHVTWLNGGYARMHWTDHPALYEIFRV